MIDYISLAIVGAVVSVLVQFIKSTFATSRTLTIAAVVVLSVVSGTGFWLVQDKSFWQSFLQILLIANAIYGFIIKSIDA